VSFAAVTLFVAYQRMFFLLFISLSTQSGNFWIHLRTYIWNQSERGSICTCERWNRTSW